MNAASSTKGVLAHWITVESNENQLPVVSVHSPMKVNNEIIRHLKNELFPASDVTKVSGRGLI